MGQVIAYKRLKAVETLKQSLQKVVEAACGRWSFTSGPKYRALNGKILVCWIGPGGRLWEVVALEIGLYNKLNQFFSQVACPFILQRSSAGPINPADSFRYKVRLQFTPLCTSTCGENASL